MKSLALGIPSIIAAVIAMACAPAATPPATEQPPSVPPGASQPTPQRGGIITYASTSQVISLHPKGSSAPERRAVGPVYDLLLSYKYEGGDYDYTVNYDVVPWLAERWEQPDSTTYLFHLRKGVQWHDGHPFTADDVVFTYEFIRDRANSFLIGSQLSSIQRIDKIDDYTVRITAKGPSPFLLQRLADVNMMILPKHVVAQGDDLAKVAIGTGPFKVKSFDPNSKSELVRNDDYWQAGKPYLDGIVVHWTLDESARLAAFVARQLDLWTASDRRQADSVKQSVPDGQAFRVTFSVGDSVIMRLDRPPFNDVRVRRALHLTLDRQGLVKAAGQGEKETIINPPGMPGQKQGYAIPPEELMKLPGYRQPKDQDLAEAKRLLAEAGIAEGTRLTMLYDRRRTNTGQTAEPIAESLRQAGIIIDLVPKDRPEYLKDLQERNYQIAMDYIADPVLNKRQLAYLHSKGSQNTMDLADPRLDSILEGMEVAMEVAEQRRLALELQRHLLDTLYVIPTIDTPAYHVLQPWVRDHQVHQSGAPFMDQAASSTTWIDQEAKKRYKS